ncbi:MAG: hypothetical protein Q7K42_04175, partial [Candidatus Diapherotrites archaeon]|nr:hypothetical protein [Candidatus Diapherotrites archaeon]
LSRTTGFVAKQGKSLKNYIKQEMDIVAEAEGQHPKNIGTLGKNATDEIGDLLGPHERHAEHGATHGAGTTVLENLGYFLEELKNLFTGGSGGKKSSGGHGGSHGGGHGGGHH